MLGPQLCTSLGSRGVLRLRLASYGLQVGGFVEAAAHVPVRYRGLPVLDRHLLAAARQRGLKVQVWTVNEEAEMERLIDLGVDGIITDRPGALKAVLARRGLWAG
jgi:glycerophosphoryl diester phosphodiesterase